MSETRSGSRWRTCWGIYPGGRVVEDTSCISSTLDCVTLEEGSRRRLGWRRLAGRCMIVVSRFLDISASTLQQCRSRGFSRLTQTENCIPMCRGRSILVPCDGSGPVRRWGRKLANARNKREPIKQPRGIIYAGARSCHTRSEPKGGC